MMKRKRSQDLAGLIPKKRSTKSTSTKDSSGPCRLLHVLSQYGLLEVIASHLFPDDLLSLALSSKLVHSAIFPNEESPGNLLKKMACDGRGVRIRSSEHQKSSFFFQYNCSEYVKCASADPSRNVETRPCAKCRAQTCDECRIHCIYQSIYESPNDPEDLPNFSGFALLSSSEMGILSPHHIDPEKQTERWRDPSSQKSRPYHDQGFLDLPLECAAHAPPESVDDILDLDLGCRTMELSLSSHVPRPSPVIQAFWQVTEQRKRWFCDTCFTAEQTRNHPNKSTTSRKCHCTLKKRFLNRWLCLRCYQSELVATGNYPRGAKSSGVSPTQCGCGHSLESRSHALCLWCMGEVSTSSNTITRIQLEDSGVGSSPE